MGALRRPGSRAGGRRLTEPSGAPFAVRHRSGSPQALVAVAVPSPSEPTLVVCEPTSGAVVLGSTQPAESIDRRACEAAGLAVVRRRSGGGAVLVRPGAQAWIDVFVPRGDGRFREDVVASFAFVGTAWRDALAGLCLPASSLAVALRGEGASSWRRALCFAGLGAGEVSFEGRKLVGISQRRDRNGAWFHSMAMLEFDPLELPRLLGLREPARREAEARLAASAAAVPGGRAAGPGLVAAVLGRLA